MTTAWRVLEVFKEDSDEETLTKLYDTIPDADGLNTEAQATMPHAHILKKNNGPGGVVYNWCSEEQKGEFNASLIKQVGAHFSYGALEGIAVEEPIDKDGGITSRALYVNKLFNQRWWLEGVEPLDNRLISLRL